MTRVAVLGAGFLGRAFYAALRSVDPETPCTHHRGEGGAQHLDYAAPDLDAVDLRGANAALLLGGVTRIAACEEDPQGSYAVNVEGTLSLARELSARGVRPIVFSSDYVFAGDAAPYGHDGARAPTTAYGRQKAELEQAVEDLASCLVVRLGKVYGTERGDGTLLDGFAAAWSRGETLSAAEDQWLSPIHVEDAVREVLARVGSAGLVHVCGRESVTRWDLAERVRVALGVEPARLERIQLGALFPDRPLDTRMLSDVEPRWTLAAAVESVAANYSA